jgi:cobalt/nickel transport system permease protein
MRLERLSSKPGALQRLDARVKLIAALAFVIVIVVTPVGAWLGLAAEGLVVASVIWLSGLPLRELARQWLTVLVLVGFLALVVALEHPARDEYGYAVVAASIVIKNSLALLTVLVLAGVTPFAQILAGLGKLGVPAVLVSTLRFMDRYRHILVDELGRMSIARRARTFSRRTALPWKQLTGLIGILFLRSFERAERVHGAMLARGWRGAIRSLDE